MFEGEFQVFDANNFSQRFRNYYHRLAIFKTFFNDILFFSVTQNFSDFKVFTCLSGRGKVSLENEKSFHLSGF